MAVVGSRNFGFITTMLGVFACGGILVPVDQHLPLQRQALMIREAKTKHLLYVSEQPQDGAWQAELSEYAVISIDPLEGQLVSEQAGVATLDAVLPTVTPDDAAYIFFTSGTTGVPKGVLGSHKGMSHFVTWQRETFGIGAEDRVAQLIHLSFDAVLRDVFLPLTSGATLCLPDVMDDNSADTLIPWIEREGITLLHTVPSLAQSWLTNRPTGVTLRTLRWMFLAGEPLTDVLVNRWRDAFPEMGEIINLYGPTETTMTKCFYQVPHPPEAGVQPAGRPLSYTQALVLNDQGILCGVGEAGEIVLRTPFRTLGYVNAPEEQAKKFVPHPFAHTADDLLYYTGDKGRYRLDGSLEIIGRMDDQVKIRGVRIQLNEITATLIGHPAVESCAVIDWKDEQDQKFLAAYVVLKADDAVSTTELRAHLEQHLPAAMVPSSFVYLTELPLTANGKVNRKALPRPEKVQVSAAELVAPRTEMEARLAEIWSEVLGLEAMGVTHNFFELGWTLVVGDTADLADSSAVPSGRAAACFV